MNYNNVGSMIFDIFEFRLAHISWVSHDVQYIINNLECDTKEMPKSISMLDKARPSSSDYNSPAIGAAKRGAVLSEIMSKYSSSVASCFAESNMSANSPFATIFAEFAIKEIILASCFLLIFVLS